MTERRFWKRNCCEKRTAIIDQYFNQKISAESLYGERSNALLTPHQEYLIKYLGAIKIGYHDNYLPFYEKDDAKGEPAGALLDYLGQ